MESIGEAIDEITNQLTAKNLAKHISEKTVHDLITTAFYASLEREELQSLKFDFIYIDPDNPDLDPPIKVRFSRWKTVNLEHPIPFTVSSLSKLGLATDRKTSTLAVHINEKNELYVWGFVDQGTNTYLFDTHESTSGWTHPGVLHVSVRDTGYLVIGCQGDKIIEIKHDSIIYPPLDALGYGHLNESLGLITDKLVTRAEKYIEEFGFTDDEEPDSPFAFNNLLRRELQRTLSRIILRIQSFGHGGAFIITPNVDSARLNIKYKLNYDRLAESLVRCEVLSILNQQYHEIIMNKFEEGRKTLDGELYFDSAIIDGELDDATEALTGSIWFASLLSRVDGLIVFDESLNIRGFGAEILVENPADHVLNATTIIAEETLRTARPIDPAQFGTRHRSMMRYINADSKGLGFVISQDGAEKIMINLEGKVVYWDGIKLTVY
ncbi:MAG TPA: hypothetical protein VGE13_04415 [Candidatus Saccharimonadales bacterium]